MRKFSVSADGTVSTVYSSKQIVVPPNSQTIIKGTTRAGPVGKMLVVSEGPEYGCLPNGLVLVPVTQYINSNSSSTTKCYVQVHNVSSKSITVPAKSQLCEIREVHLAKRRDIMERNKTQSSVTCSSMTQMDASCDEFLQKFNLHECPLTTEQKQQIEQLLLKWKCIFALNDLDLGCTHTVTHHIKLTESTPFKERYRHIPPNMYEEVRNHIQEMLDSDVIRLSNSPFASPVVLVRKKDGSLRFCIDFRKLNSRTIKDAHALPRIDEALDTLSGSSWFSALDLKAGYWQVEVAEADKEKTAFTVGPLGFYEYNRMPFGLVNAPATFQRLMTVCMGDLNLTECLLYLDDIIVFSKSFESHLQRLEHVFQRLKDHGLKLKPSKCTFFQSKVKYLGHVVSKEGIHTDPDKIETVQNWPIPVNVKSLRRFLGFTGFYRRFIKGYAKVARPLYDQLKGDTTVKSKSRTKKKQKMKDGDKQPTFQWGTEQQNAFNHLINLLTKAPILAYADYSKSFILHTDASRDGLGAILYQKQQDNSQRVIAYASRGLSPSERNYPAHKLEFLALKWAVTDKFRDYLHGNQFTVFTDNNPLTYVLTTAKLDATGHRWLAELASFDFDIQYRSGKKNVDADALSRIRKYIGHDVISAVCQSSTDYSLIETLNVASMNVGQQPSSTLCQLSNEDWIHNQSSDPLLSKIIKHIQQGTEPSIKEIELKPVVRQFHKFVLRDNVLYRQVVINRSEFFQLVLPSQYHRTALQGVHQDMGHPGCDRTYNLLQERFYWPSMKNDVTDWVKNCGRCIRRKSIKPIAPLVSIHSTRPLELVCMDYLSLEESKGGVKDVLVITDHYTKYAVAVPTRNQTARTTAEALFNNFICHYGFPERLHSDQGRNFESKVISQVCKLGDVKKSRTTPYHPMGNGQCERFNRTLLNMLGTCSPQSKLNWKLHVAPLVHAYNCMRHETTGYSPFYMMFGRQPRLGIDLILGIKEQVEQEEMDHNTYMDQLKHRLQSAYKLASSLASERQHRQKTKYDTKVKGAALSPGDRVLIQCTGFKGPHKLENRWSKEVYVIEEQPDDTIPVFKVCPESDRGPAKTLHRNFLLPIGYMLEEDDTDLRAPEQHRPRTRNYKKSPSAEHNVSSSSSDHYSDDEEYVVIGQPSTRNRIPKSPPSVHSSYGRSPSSESVHQILTQESLEDHVPSDDSANPIESSDQADVLDISRDFIDLSTQPDATPKPRRSQRIRQPPQWFRSSDYM